MREQKDFSYYTYEVGREGYKAETKKLVWNVFNEENGKIVPINIFEYNWVFLKEGLLYAKKHYSDNFNEFADHIRGWLQHEYWSRCQYETTITTRFSGKIKKEDLKEIKEEIKKNGGFTYINIGESYKMDIYTQVMLNWDRFIDYVWNNKKLITKKKLGLE